MSGIVRSVLFRHRISRLSPINIFKENSILISRALSVSQYRLQNNAVDAQVKKLDMDVRKNGRISRRDVDGILNEIKVTRSATPTQSLLIIRCCGSLISEELPEIRTKLVQEVWNVFEKLGVNLDISHYNALLRVYLENEYAFSPSEFLEQLEKRGIEPNRVTYQRLISKYCQSGDIAGATRVLEVMREKEIPVNESIFNSLILGHSRANDMKSAEGILDVMKQAGLEPSAETYTLLICGYISQGELDKIYSILDQCEANDVYFIDKDYLEIIYALAKYNYDDHIDKILNKIKKSAGYNQDAISYIYKLCSMGKIDIGYKMLKTMVRPVRVDGSVGPSGNFFISYLVKSKLPPAEIVKYCDKLVEDKIHTRPLVTAMECALRHRYEEAVLPLFRAAKERNIPIKQHYFWPLIVENGKRNDIDGLMHVLLAMSSDFNIPVSADTIREYVAPFVLKENGNYEDALTRLKLSGVSFGAATSGLVTALLEQKNIKKAAELSLRHRAYYFPATIRRPLAQSLAETKDIPSFMTILNQVCAGIQWAAENRNMDETKEEDEEQIPDHVEFVSQIACDTLKLLINYPSKAEFMENLLQSYVDAGFALKTSSAQYIQTLLQSDLTLAISTLIEKLTSADMMILSAQTSAPRFREAVTEIDESTLEQLYESSKTTGDSKRAIQKQLFTLYARNKNIDKLLELKKELEAEDFVLTEGMHAMLIDTFVNHNRLDEALDTYETVRQKNPDFVINKSKLLRLALLLVQNDQVDKALQYLQHKDKNSVTGESSFSDGVTAWRILNTLAEKGDIESVKKFLDIFRDKNYVEVTNVLLGPLIKAHLTTNDVLGALEEFENCALKYRCTPWKSDIAARLIQAEDANALQRLTDISTQIHGEINSLYDLMLSFLECGRIRQAKKILETPGLRLRQDRLYNASHKYQNEGSSNHLENLLEITRGINSFDRSDICYNLLVLYNKSNDVNKASSLWIQMQEEDIQPNDHFLYLLSELLKKNDKPVPFTPPEHEPAEKIIRSGPPKYSSATQELRKLIRDDKVDEALKHRTKVNIEQLTANDLSSLVQASLNHNRYDDAKSVLLDIFQTGAVPIIYVLRHFCLTAMKNGDYEVLQKIKAYLPLSSRQLVKIDNRICGAYEVKGMAKEYLSKLESELDSMNSPDEYETFMKSYPKGGLLGLLMKYPELLPEVERISEKCALRNSQQIVPMNTLWTYHMLKGNYDEADKIWKNYLQQADKPVSFGSVIKHAFSTSNEELLNKLFNMFKDKKDLPVKALGIIYSAYIDFYLKENNVREALTKLDEAVDAVSLENLKMATLKAARIAAGIHSIPFKYDLNREVEQSSSDDDN